MQLINLKFSQLVQNFTHIGHNYSTSERLSSWYVFGVRFNLLLISPFKIVFFWKKAIYALLEIYSEFGSVLLINLDKSLNFIYTPLSKLTHQPIVFNRWRAGLLTNWKLAFLRKLPILKKPISPIRPSKHFIANLNSTARLPSAIFLLNSASASFPISEAYSLNIPIFSIVDTDLNSSGITFPIPGNDDSISANFFYTIIISKVFLFARLDAIAKFSKIKEVENL